MAANFLTTISKSFSRMNIYIYRCPCQRFLKTLVEVSKHRNTVFMLLKADHFLMQYCGIYGNMQWFENVSLCILCWINHSWVLSRAGAGTRFTSTSTSTSICNMCEYEYEYEYLIITWVRVRVRVLVDEYEYKCEYRSMINILYSKYRQQIFIVRSLTRESSDCYKPGTKLKLPIVHVNYLCQYISV